MIPQLIQISQSPGGFFSAAGRRRADGRAKTMARINANDDWRRFTEHVAEAT